MHSEDEAQTQLDSTEAPIQQPATLMILHIEGRTEPYRHDSRVRRQKLKTRTVESVHLGTKTNDFKTTATRLTPTARWKGSFGFTPVKGREGDALFRRLDLHARGAQVLNKELAWDDTYTEPFAKEFIYLTLLMSHRDSLFGCQKHSLLEMCTWTNETYSDAMVINLTPPSSSCGWMTKHYGL